MVLPCNTNGKFVANANRNNDIENAVRCIVQQGKNKFVIHRKTICNLYFYNNRTFY